MTRIFDNQSHYPRTPTVCLNIYTICTAYEIRATLRLWHYYIIIIVIIIIIISFMQGIYTYIPETNYVPREYSVAAILLLLFTCLYH